MTYPFEDCCPNLPSADPGCDDGWCCTHGTRHEEPEEPEEEAFASSGLSV